ncbi:dentin sialophosphoprotein-like [Copidosoma floridanum]|uniref:dentin sialophosphoprotein-like n=1 Tax=Copidosoma floridanum TaxID=29053 RepID=UPI0006C96B13|nr:dentin sialophosphoprotein-like [Copidosoma floridanum]
MVLKWKLIDEDVEIVNEVSYSKIQKTTVSNPSSDSSEVVVVAKSKTDEPETDQCPETDPNTEKHDHKYSKAPQTISKECHPADQDEKLLSKCYVLLDNLETLQGNYQNDCSSLCGLVNSNSPVEEFQRLLNLEDLEKKRKRDYSSSDSVESKRSNRAKKVSKKLKNSTSSSSDSDTFSDSSDSSSKSYSDSSNNSFQLEVNEPVNDFHEERLKQNLLSSEWTLEP